MEKEAEVRRRTVDFGGSLCEKWNGESFFMSALAVAAATAIGTAKKCSGSAGGMEVQSSHG